MGIVTCLLVLSTSFRLFAQDTVFYWKDTGNRKEEGRLESGKKSGIWKLYNPIGVLQSTGRYENDKREGEWFSFSGDGKPYDRMTYLKGLLNGSFARFTYLDGDSLCGYYHVGKEDGLWLGYSNQKVVETRQYKDGKSIGIWKKYYPSGQLASISSRKKLSVRWVWEKDIFSENGGLIEKQYFDSKSKGCATWISYYENQKIKEEKKYKNGLSNGISRGFYSNGILKEKLRYNNGHLFGTCYTYYENGVLETKGAYVLVKAKNEEKMVSVRAGMWVEYYPNGKIKAKGEYFPDYQSKLDTVYTHDESNRILFYNKQIFLKDKKWIDYSEDGKSAFEELYDKGRLISRKEIHL